MRSGVVNEIIQESLALPGADVTLYHDFFQPEECSCFFEELRDQIKWEQRIFHVKGKDIPFPRRISWYGDPGAHYTYSRVEHTPHLWTDLLLHIRSRIEEATDAHYNSVLLNLYQDEHDSVNWHQDNETCLGVNPTIASVSFGAERVFSFKPAKGKLGTRTDVLLPNGSVLLMKGETQTNWHHAILKCNNSIGPRINLTFRWIYS